MWPEGVPLADLVLGAFAVTIVAYAESLAAAKTYARKHGYVVDPNQELIGLGVANLGAGLSQGFVVTDLCQRPRQVMEQGRRPRWLV
jgi:MFS superfamily sulfate permease-like transporter